MQDPDLHLAIEATAAGCAATLTATAGDKAEGGGKGGGSTDQTQGGDPLR
jgi:hypothetical protein